jgi:hypothetical protein
MPVCQGRRAPSKSAAPFALLGDGSGLEPSSPAAAGVAGRAPVCTSPSHSSAMTPIHLPCDEIFVTRRCSSSAPRGPPSRLTRYTPIQSRRECDDGARHLTLMASPRWKRMLPLADGCTSRRYWDRSIVEMSLPTRLRTARSAQIQQVLAV